MNKKIFETTVADCRISLTKLDNDRFLVISGCNQYTYQGIDRAMNEIACCIKRGLQCAGKLKYEAKQ